MSTDKIMSLVHAHRIAQGVGDMLDASSAIRAEIEALAQEVERLDWMIFHSAKVHHNSDGEFCTVTWYDDDGQKRETNLFGSARQAIDAAMKGKTT